MSPQSSAYKLLVSLYRGMLRRVRAHMRLNRMQTRDLRRQATWALRTHIELLHPRFMWSATPANTETLLNQLVAAYTQSKTAIVMDNNGVTTAVWQSNGQDLDGWGIYGRRFDSGGNPLGNEFLINQTTTLNQTDPSIAVDGAGDFVVAWTSDQSGTNALYARVFDASGTPLTSDINVANSATSVQNADVAMSTNGNFVVTWEGNDATDLDGGVFYQCFDLTGTNLGGQVRVNTTTANNQFAPSVAMDAVGNFVVAWTDNSGAMPAIRGQQFSSARVPQGSEFAVGLDGTAIESNPSVGADAAGNFVVAWTGDLGTPSGLDVYARRFSSTGVAIDASPVMVNTDAVNAQDLAAVSVRYDGQYGIAWASQSADGLSWGTFGQCFNPDGTFDGTEFQANTTTSPSQPNTTLAWNGSQAVIGWDGNGTGDAEGAFAQWYTTQAAANQAPFLTLPPAGQATVEETALTFSSSNGNLIGFVDPELGTASARVTLTVTGGTVVPATSAGLTFTIGSGAGGATLRFSGTAAALNAALDGLTFTPTANFNGQAAIQIAVDDLGNSGSGGPQTTTATIPIDVAPVADTPSITSASTVINLQTNNGLVVTRSAVDGSETGYFQVTGISNGQLYLSDGVTEVTNNQFLTFAQGAAGLRFTPSAGSTSTGTVSVQASTTNTDAGLAGAKVTATITVYALPQIATHNVSTTEDAPVTLSAGNAIVITDALATANGLVDTVTLTATHGALTLTSTAGLTFTAGDGSGDATMTFHGSVPAINAALGGLTFTPSTNFNGQGSIAINVANPGTSFTGGPLTASGAVTVDVTPVADTPSITNAKTLVNLQTNNGLVVTRNPLDGPETPYFQVTGISGGTLYLADGVTQVTNNQFLTFAQGAAGLKFTPNAGSTNTGNVSVQASTTNINAGLAGAKVTANITVYSQPQLAAHDVSTNEDASVALSAGNAISLTDAMATAEGLADTVTLTAPNGTLTLASTAGLTFTAGDGAGNATMTFRGSVAAINTALNGLTFTPSSHFIGQTSIAITAVNPGTSFTGGPLTTSASVAIDVSAVTYPPSITDAQTAVNLQTNNGLVVARNPLDGPETPYFQVTGITGGTLYLADGITQVTNNQFLTFAQGAAGLKFSPNAGSTNTGTVSVQASTTNTNGGLGGTKTTATITVYGPPVLATNNVQTPEDTPRTLSGANAIVVTDALAGTTGVDTVTLTAGNGTLTLASTAGLSFAAGDGTGDATMTFTGTVAAINTALNGLVFTPSSHFIGQTSIGITVVNPGTSFTAGSMTTSDSVTVDVSAVTYPPSITDARTSINFQTNNGLVVTRNPLDGPETPYFQVTGIGDGKLYLADGVTQIVNNQFLTFTQGAAGLKFTPNAGSTHTGKVSVQASTTNTTAGLGGTKVTANIAVYGPPTINSKNVHTTEDTPLALSAGNAIEVDDALAAADGIADTVTLTASNGALTLASTAGLTFTAGDGTGDPTMTFSGTVVAINAALDGLTFTPPSHFIGQASITISATTPAMPFTNGAMTTTDAVTIDVDADTHPPSFTDARTAVNLQTNNGLVVTRSPLDGAETPYFQVSGISGGKLYLSDGTTQIANGQFLTFAQGAAGLKFTPSAGSTSAGKVSVQASTTNSNGGLGGAKTVATITVYGPPAIDTRNVSTAENTPIALTGGNAIVVTDALATADSLADTVTLTTGTGTLTLASTAGLTFTAGDGSSDATMTFSGSVAAINTALNGLTFTPPTYFNGTTTIQVSAVNPGTSFTGGPRTSTASFNVNVTAVNNAPVNVMPAPQLALENTPLVLSTATGNAILVQDVDAAASDKLLVTLTATHGTLTLASSTGLTFKPNGGGPSTWIFTGTLTRINAALDGLKFTPAANYDGPAQIKITTNDQGNTGSGGSLTTTSTLALTVSPGFEPISPAGAATQVTAAVNAEAPALAVDASGNAVAVWAVRGNPGQGVFAQRFDPAGALIGGVIQISSDSIAGGTEPSVAVDAAGDFAVAWSTGGSSVYVRPYDATGSPLAAAALVTSKNDGLSAALAAAPDGGFLVAWAGNGNGQVKGVYAQRYTAGGAASGGTALLYATNGIDAVDAAADSIGNYAVAWASNEHGAAVRAVTLPAPGAAGAPTTVTVATAASGTYEDARIGFDGSGNFLVTWDDHGASPYLFARRFTSSGVAIDPAAATLPIVADTAHVAPALSVGPDGGYVIAWRGAAVQNGPVVVLAQLFEPDGTPVLAPIQVNGGTAGNPDQVATAWGPYGVVVGWSIDGPNGLSGVYTRRFGVAGQASPAPRNVIPGRQATPADTALLFSAGAGNRISISDPAAGTTGQVQVTLAAAHGTVTLALTAGLTFTTGDGTADQTVTFSGTVAAINAALDGMQYMPDLGYDGSAPLQVSTTNPTSGAGSTPQTTASAIPIYVSAGNHVPVISAPAVQSVDQNGALVFSGTGGNALTVDDIDAGSAAERITLTATHGTLSLAGAWGLTFTAGTGSGDASMTFTGTLADINAALTGLTFTPTADYAGSASVQLTIDDLGHTGPGGAQTATATVGVTVVPVNQAPVIAVPSAQIVAKNQPLAFSAANGNALFLTDVDAGGANERLTLSAANGTLAFAQTTGLTFSAGTGSGDATMTFTGSLAAINGALDGLTFTPATGYSGPASVTLAVNDLGNTGPGGPKSAVATVAVTVATSSSVAAVDTTADVVDGNTSSLGTLLLAKGADGRISLREAILAANNTPGLNEIVFAIPDTDARHFYYREDGIAGSLGGAVSTTLADAFITDFDSDYAYAPHSWFSIQLDSNLPQLALTNRLIIDGYAQPGAAANTLTLGDDAVLRIELTSTLGGVGTNSGLAVLAGGAGSEIRGLAVNGFAGAGILLDTGSDGTIVDGNFLGTDVTGSIGLANGGAGLEIRSDGASLGGPAAAQRNLLSGNAGPGLMLAPASGTVDAAVVENNYIGVDATGTRPVGNAGEGISANGVTNSVILDNIISANAGAGIAFLTSADTGNAVLGNLIGTGADGSADLGNGGDGILLDNGASGNTIGGLATGEGNAISFNDGAGVNVQDADRVEIRGNSISGNGGRGIDLGGDGVTANTGVMNAALPNDGMNTPVLTGAIVDGSTLALTGYVGTASGQSDFAGALIDVYVTVNGRKEYLGTLTAAADGTFAGAVSAADVASGAAITATATDAVGNTSEFSASTGALVRNQPPSVDVPAAAQSVRQEESLTFSAAGGNAIVIADADAADGSTEQVTLTASDGTLSLGTVFGLTFSTGDGSDDASMTFAGTLEDINSALDALAFRPADGFNGTTSVQVDVDDLGNSGAGGARTTSAVVSVTVTPVAHSPSVTGATTGMDMQSAGGLVVSRNATDGSAITHFKVTNITGGTLFLHDGTTPVADDAFLTFAQGAAGLRFTPAPGSLTPGAFDIQASTAADDSGLGGGVVTATVTVVTVPEISVPAPQSTAEDAGLILSTIQGNAIQISHASVGGGNVAVTLTASVGALTLSDTAGLSFTSGSGVADATMTFEGTLSDINAALDGLTLATPANYFGPATIQISTDDLGNAGTPSPLTDADSVDVTVTPVAATPSVTAATANRAGQSTSGLVISRNATDGAEVTHFKVTNVSGGTLYLADGTTPVIAGSFVTAAQGAAGLRFTPASGTTADGSFDVQASTSADDAGLGGGVVTAAITVNDPPFLSGETPGGDYVEGQPPVAVAPLLLIGDGDSASVQSATIRVTNYAIGEDVLSFTNQNGITGSWDASTGTLSLTGTASSATYEQALRSVTYSNTSDAPDTTPRSIALTATDSGGATSAAVSASVSVTAVNDSPSLALPPSQTTAEDTALVFSTAHGNAIVVSDVDAAGNNVEVSLTASNGRLSLASVTNLTLLTGSGSDDIAITFRGTIADVAAALNGLTFRPDADFSGTASVTVFVTDLGNSGSGAAGFDNGTVSISVTPVNDAPTAIVPGTQVAGAGNHLTFSAADGNAITVDDVDSAGGDLEVELKAEHGTVILPHQGGLTFLEGNGVNDSKVRFRGSPAAINVALEGMRFDLTDASASNAGIQLKVNDLGNIGAGGPETASAFIPVHSYSAGIVTVTPTSGLTTTEAGGTATFAVTLDRQPTSDVTISLASSDPTEGTLSATSVTFTPADWATPKTVVVTGVDDALDDGDIGFTVITGDVVSADGRFDGVIVDDVSLINLDNEDLPVVTFGASAGVEYVEGAAPVIVAGQFTISCEGSVTSAMVELGDSYVAGEDRLEFQDDPSDGISAQWDDRAGRLTLSGQASSAAYEAALQSISYVDDSQDPADDAARTVRVSVTGSHGTSQPATRNVSVTAVNSPPSNFVPGDQQIEVDAPLVFTSARGNAVRVGDPDVRNGFVQVTLRARKGSITLPATRGVAFTLGNGRGNVVMTFSGLVSSVNEALNGMEFRPTAGFSGDATITITTDDLGNRGVGGRKTAETQIRIAVQPAPEPAVVVVVPDGGGDQGGDDSTSVVPTPNDGGSTHDDSRESDGRSGNQGGGRGQLTSSDGDATKNIAPPRPSESKNQRPGNVLLLGGNGDDAVFVSHRAEQSTATPRVMTVDGELVAANLLWGDEVSADLASFRERASDTVRSAVRSVGLSTDLDHLRSSMTNWSDLQHMFAGSAAFVSLGMSVAYVLYTVRAGYMLTSMLSGMPVWNMVDPLPILDHLEGTRRPDDEEGESLESMVSGDQGRHGRRVKSRVLSSKGLK